VPIGIAAGAAVIGAGASIYSSSQASKAQTHAANTASDTALQVANTNNAFAQSIYDQNEGHLTPFIDFGTSAGGNLMELLTGKKAAAPTASTGTTTPAPKPATGYTGPGLGSIGSQSQMDQYLGYYQAHPEQDPGFTSIAPFHGDAYKDEDSANAVLAARQAYIASHPATPATPAPTGPNTQHPTNPAATPASTGNAAQSAWNTYKNSTQYQERLNTGLNATASKYAAGGAFESGAEKKAINDYAQTFASNEIANYMDQLYRQEALGASAASSLAGVGTNLVSQVSANNNNAGNAAANAALVRGQSSANNWNNIGNAVGQAAGAIGGAFGSSYGGGGYDYQALQNSGIYAGAGWDF
jgi:hypothetical protein